MAQGPGGLREACRRSAGSGGSGRRASSCRVREGCRLLGEDGPTRVTQAPEAMARTQERGCQQEEAVTQGSWAWAAAKGGGRPVLENLPSLWPCVVRSRWRRRWLSGVQPALDSLSTGLRADELRETEAKLTSHPFPKSPSTGSLSGLPQASTTCLPPSASLALCPFPCRRRGHASPPWASGPSAPLAQTLVALPPVLQGVSHRTLSRPGNRQSCEPHLKGPDSGNCHQRSSEVPRSIRS